MEWSKVIAEGNRVSFFGDETVLELGISDGCATIWES